MVSIEDTPNRTLGNDLDITACQLQMPLFYIRPIHGLDLPRQYLFLIRCHCERGSLPLNENGSRRTVFRLTGDSFVGKNTLLAFFIPSLLGL